VPDSSSSGQLIKNLTPAAKYTPDRTHARIALKGFTVARCDTGRFLPPVLKAVQTEIRLLHRLGVAEYAK
jgi:hypothetical protein